jgi:hypothetical protein
MLMSRFESVLRLLPQADLNIFIGYLSLDVLRNVISINKTISILIQSTNAYWQTIYMKQFECPYVACEEDFILWYRSTHLTDTDSNSKLNYNWQAIYRHRKHLEQRILNGRQIQQSIELPHTSGCYWHVVATCASGFLVLAKNTQTITSDQVYLIRTPNLFYDNNAFLEDDTSTPLYPPVMIELKITAKIESLSQMSYYINHRFIVISHKTALSVWKTQSDKLYNIYCFDFAVNIISIRNQWVLLEQQSNDHPFLLLNLLTGDRVPCVIPAPSTHLLTDNIYKPVYIEDTCSNKIMLYCNHSYHDDNTSKLYWSVCGVDVISGIASLVRYGICQVDASVFGHFSFRRLGSGLVAWNFRFTTTQRRNMVVHSIDGNGNTPLYVFMGANAIHRISKYLLLIIFSQRMELFNIHTNQTEFTWYHTITKGPFIPIIGPYWLVYDIFRDEDGAHSCAKINELRVGCGANDTMDIWHELDMGTFGEVSATNQLYVTPCGMLRRPENSSSLLFYGFNS